MNPVDGLCHIGLPTKVLVPLLVFDIVINVLLTLTFVYLLGPVIRLNDISGPRRSASRVANAISSCCFESRKRSINVHLGNPHVARRIEKLMWRTFIGSVLVLIPTVANLVQLIILHGSEKGFLCLTICTLDGMFFVYSSLTVILTLQSCGRFAYCTGL
jgi:hypothetical protein